MVDGFWEEKWQEVLPHARELVSMTREEHGGELLETLVEISRLCETTERKAQFLSLMF